MGITWGVQVAYPVGLGDLSLEFRAGMGWDLLGSLGMSWGLPTGANA